MNEQKKNKLLIVDDDKSNLMTLAHILQSEYTILVASDGKAALRIAERHLPDLILTDIVMSGMDGYQVFDALQRLDKTAHIPVIFISGLNNDRDEKKGLIMGAVDYINKPFDEMIVRLRVRHQMRIVNQLRTIEHLSMIDQLTGIPNRRNFDSRLQVEWARAVRERAPVCLLMLDVDYFKHYNDRYGHQQGDKALCLAARTATETLKRASDMAARWGGEEFAVLLPNTDTEGGVVIGNQIRENIEAAEIICDDGSVTRVTVSVGVYACAPAADGSIDEFISRADTALYAAKNTGRNRVRVYEP